MFKKFAHFLVAGLLLVAQLAPAGAVVIGVDRINATGATAPALTSCGTTPSITGNDLAGTVTMGSSATGCVITFAVAYPVAPFCVVTWIATPLASQSYTTSTAAITLTQTSASNNVVKYVCIGNAQ